MVDPGSGREGDRCCSSVCVTEQSDGRGQAPADSSRSVSGVKDDPNDGSRAIRTKFIKFYHSQLDGERRKTFLIPYF